MTILPSRDAVAPFIECPTDLVRMDTRLADLAGSVEMLQRQLDTALERAAAIINPREIFAMMKKNKWGFNKEEAKKLFYSYRSKTPLQADATSTNPKPGYEPESTEQKIAMIMAYMKETSAKLDRIEDDIAELKEKVNAVLKKI